jgi:hypothetical protein
MATNLDDVLFNYVSCGNPKSNENLKQFLRLYPKYREEIVDFTATWRVLSILEKVLPPPPLDPVVERQMMQHAKADLRVKHRHRTGTLPEKARVKGGSRKGRQGA